MLPIRMVPPDTKIRFIEFRKLAFMFSLLLVFTSLAVLFARGLNFGIDFEGGTLMEVRTNGPANLASMRAELARLPLGTISLQEFGQPNEVLIRVERQKGDEKQQIKAIKLIKKTLGKGVEYRRTEFVGPKVGSELKTAGTWAVVLSMAGILLYVWFRFEWQFGVSAVVALAHDVISTIGIFAALQLEFNLSTLAAILTIAGYSINDTVVVFDRVRENLRKYKREDLGSLLNRSINDTLSRTVMTSLTTLLALVALYTFGGAVIRDFSFAMIWGIIVGTYSSIFVAAPMLLYLKLHRVGRGGEKAQKDETTKSASVKAS